MQVTDEILHKIADELEAGFICYLHRESLEVFSIPDPDRFLEIDKDIWKEELAEVKKNRKKLVEIERMKSSDAFRVMMQFAESLPAHPIKIRLLNLLEGKRPFAHFKELIENSGEYRELWFAFRRQKNVDWIKEQLPLEMG